MDGKGTGDQEMPQVHYLTSYEARSTRRHGGWRDCLSILSIGKEKIERNTGSSEHRVIDVEWRYLWLTL